jgi:hypothetical protein
LFRLAEDAFQADKELHSIAVYCITETIKAHVEEYLEQDYEKEEGDNLYIKVKKEKAFDLFPFQIMDSMMQVGVNVSSFIPKKIAEFMLLLKDKEEHTPDLFLEYILYRMIKKQSENRYDYTPNTVVDKKAELKSQLRKHAKGYTDYDTKERNLFIKNNIRLLTEFTYLLGVEESGDSSLTFWDWDFLFFDDWGFKEVIEQSAFGVLRQRGYGLEYTKSIFKNVGEEVPLLLKQK